MWTRLSVHTHTLLWPFRLENAVEGTARFSGYGKTEWDTDVGDEDAGGLTRTNSRQPIHNGDPATSLPRLRTIFFSLALRTSFQRERGKHAGRPRCRLDSAEVKLRLSSAFSDFINSETAVFGAEGPDVWVIWGWISGSVPEQ